MTRAYDLVQLRSAVQLLQASLEEVSHTAKVLCHENESLKREKEAMIKLVRIMQGEGTPHPEKIKDCPRNGLMWWYIHEKKWVPYTACRILRRAIWDPPDSDKW